MTKELPRSIKVLAFCSSLVWFVALTSCITSLKKASLPSQRPILFHVSYHVAAVVVFVLMQLLIRPRPTKPVGSLFKLLLEIACLQVALLLRYYCRTIDNDDIWVDLFVLMLSTSSQVYSVFFAFRCSPDVSVWDVLFVMLMQSLIYGMPSTYIGIVVAIQFCAFAIALKYHRSPHHKYEEEEEEDELASVCTSYSNDPSDPLLAKMEIIVSTL